MMKRLTVIRLATLLAAICRLDAASPVWAADHKILMPSLCNGLTAADNDRLNKYQWLANSSTTNRAEVSCAVVRDNTTNTNGLSGLRVRVDGDVICYFYSQDVDGFIVQTVGRTNASGRVTLDWGTAVNLSVSGGTYMLYCSLGPQASVRSIWISEY